MAGTLLSIVTGPLARTTTRAVVAVPSTTSTSSSSAVSSSRVSSSSTSSIVSSTSSSSVRSSTTSSVASTTSSSRASSSSSRTSASSLRASSTLASSSAAASASASSAPESTGLSSLAKSLIIAGIVVASAIALIVAVGFLLRRRRDGRRDRRDRTHELDGYGKDGGPSSPHIEKDQPGVGDERFVQALGRGERPSGRAGTGMGGIYGASAGAGAMYAGSEASLQQPPMAVNDGGWGSAGGYDASGYPPQQAYSPGGFAPPHSASQQYLVQRGPSPAFANHNQQQPYSPSYGNPQDEYFRSPSPYGQHPPPPPPPPQQQSYYSSNQQPYDAQPQHDPYQDPSPLEAQAMAGVGGDPSLGGALVPGGALDEEGVEMRVVRGFKATLEDELAIVPFILLRVHQSYEDGWSLCSNPGTKERGVVPRDCLALPSSLPSNALPPSPPSQPRTLPQIPSQSFSSSNLYDPSSSVADRSSQYANNSKHQEALDENDHPLAPPPTFGFAVGYEDNNGRPLSVVVRDEDGTEREVMRSELGPGGAAAAAGASGSSGEFGGLDVGGIPRSRTATSLTPSERTERRSSLMDSVRAAGAYLDQGGASGTHL
ncbi:hypothetical protein BDY24DRAFT_441211 [Mrakia frigida]|uniref:uncharacterized protein n=1 Tax=Mrakia frigida TaxID=29902 RepID=UPI003FCC0AC3